MSSTRPAPTSSPLLRSLASGRRDSLTANSGAGYGSVGLQLPGPAQLGAGSSAQGRAHAHSMDSWVLQLSKDCRGILGRHGKMLALMLVVFVAIAACGLFVPREHVTPHFQRLNASTVEKWAMPKAECDSGMPKFISINAADDNGQVSVALACEKAVLTWKSYVTMAITFGALLLMVADAPPDLTLLGATLFLLALGIIDGNDAWGGLSNQGVLSVAILFIVARALEETGIVDRALRSILGRPGTLFVAMCRLCFPVAVISAFMNNTPVVAMMIPIVESWSDRIGISKSRLLMPLSFASMLGGMCTLIGTSTNLIVQGLIRKRDPTQIFTMFELVPVAVPCMVFGIVYMAIFAKCLLSGKEDAEDSGVAGDPAVGRAKAPMLPLFAARGPSAAHEQRRYIVCFEVAADSPLQDDVLANTGVLSVPDSELLHVVRGSLVLYPHQFLPPEEHSVSYMVVDDHEEDNSGRAAAEDSDLKEQPAAVRFSPPSTVGGINGGPTGSWVPVNDEDVGFSERTRDSGDEANDNDSQAHADSPKMSIGLMSRSSGKQPVQRGSPHLSASSASPRSRAAVARGWSLRSITRKVGSFMGTASADDSASGSSEELTSGSASDDEWEEVDSGGNTTGVGSRRGRRSSRRGKVKKKTKKRKRKRKGRREPRTVGPGLFKLHKGDKCIFSASAPAVVALRNGYRGFQPCDVGLGAVSYLGRRRHTRRLVEVVLDRTSSLVGMPLLDCAKYMLTEYNVAALAVRMTSASLQPDVQVGVPGPRTSLLRGSPPSVHRRGQRDMAAGIARYWAWLHHHTHSQSVRSMPAPPPPSMARSTDFAQDKHSNAARRPARGRSMGGQPGASTPRHAVGSSWDDNSVASRGNPTNALALLRAPQTRSTVDEFGVTTGPATVTAGVPNPNPAILSQSALERPLHHGDALLLETFPSFLTQYHNSAEFALVREVEGSKPPRRNTVGDRFRAIYSVVVLVGMVMLSAFNVMPLLEAALFAAMLLIAAKCITINEAFSSVKSRVILAIVAAFGVGAAMDKTGVAGVTADGLVHVSEHFGAGGVLTAVLLVTGATTSVVSNNATVILMFPICLKAHDKMPSIPIKQFLVVLMIGASSAFLTPIAYQTNLMVLDSGRYSFGEFFKFGVLLQLLVCVVAIVCTQLFF